MRERGPTLAIFGAMRQNPENQGIGKMDMRIGAFSSVYIVPWEEAPPRLFDFPISSLVFVPPGKT